MSCTEIYTTKIYIENISDDNYRKLLIDKTYELIKNKSVKNNEASVRNGWQSEKDMYRMNEFFPLCEKVLRYVSSKLLKENSIVPYISAMWINVHEKEGFNHVHVHPGAWYSGVYYLNCTEKTGDIVFLDPRPGAQMSFYHTITESKNICVSPKNGDLILFPAWLPHMVESNLDEEHRISVAFNIELDV
jgi:uncharacterized protein (TIGR02466 family)